MLKLYSLCKKNTPFGRVNGQQTSGFNFQKTE